jgi:hypothetical protein
MKHLSAALAFLVCLCFVQSTQAQTNFTNDYVVITTNDVPNVQSYTDALDAANWEDFRLQNQRCQLAFDNGFTIELKSAVELFNAGQPLIVTNYRVDNPSG